MLRVKRIMIILFCAIIVAAIQPERVKAAQKETGYHSLNKKIQSPEPLQEKKPYARTSKGYYNSLELGQVTSVKNQGNTELCWAFGLTSLGETSLIKQGMAKQTVDFSEKHLGYFMYNRKNDALNNTKGDRTKILGNWKYSGGNSQLAMIALTGWYGLADESVAPFESSKWALSDRLAQKDKAILKNGFFLGDNPSIDVIKSYIMKYGSVVMAYHAPDSTSERLKYYDINQRSYNCTNSQSIANHIVTIVGWNDNYHKNKFGKGSMPKKNGAWIIKNSWGVQEGDKGYTYISYEDRSMCEFLSGQFTKATDYKYNYFYDGSSNPSSIRLKKGQKFANVFKAKKGTKKKKEVIKAINLVTWSPNLKYSIQIYKNPKKGNPASGKKLLTKEVKGTIKEAGTHTIAMNKKVKVVKGDRFSVVVKMRSKGYIGYDQTEDYGWISFVNKTAKDQSYMYLKGTWQDLNVAKMTMRLKVYTTR